VPTDRNGPHRPRRTKQDTIIRYLRTPHRPAAALAAAAVTIIGTAAVLAQAAPVPPDQADHGDHDRAGLLVHLRPLLRRIHPRYRVLLAAAFAGLTQQLDRLGLDQPGATMPALTGNHDSDWTRFAAVYQRITSKLPAKAVRQQAAEATMTAMIKALNNNHSYWFTRYRIRAATTACARLTGWASTPRPRGSGAARPG
jgi:hypothetical protein